MFAFIARIFTGTIFDKLTGLYEKKLASDNASHKLAAEVAIQNLEADMEVRRNAKEIRLATAGFWEMRTITFMIAFPFVVHLWAVGMDTVFGFGWRIPKFPTPFDEWQGVILLSFFGVQVVGKGFDTLAYIFGKKR